MSKPKLEITKDFTDDFAKVILKLKNDKVLVGIPASTSPRQDGKINNATILAINEFGSAANNIPPRNVVETGIKNVRDRVADEFAKIVDGTLSKGTSNMRNAYERIGIIASTSVKKAINSQDWTVFMDNEGPAESTLKARRSRGFTGEKSLIVTGQLRNAITYVVRDE